MFSMLERTMSTWSLSITSKFNFCKIPHDSKNYGVLFFQPCQNEAKWVYWKNVDEMETKVQGGLFIKQHQSNYD